MHLTSFVVFLGATVHAVQAGSDAGDAVMQWFALLSVALVGFLAMFRVRRRPPRTALGDAGQSSFSATAFGVTFILGS